MIKIEINNRINQIMDQYCRLKVWQRENTTQSSLQVIVKYFYFAIHLSYVIAVFSGLFLCDDNELVFQTAALMAYSVINVKLYYVLWYQTDICSFLHDLCCHSVSDGIDRIESIRIKRKLNAFVKFVSIFLILAGCGTIPFFGFNLPIFTNVRKLPLMISLFPLNWRNNIWSYWAAYLFITFNHVLTVVILSSSVIIWYIMINCSIKYELLGSELRRIGVNVSDVIKVTPISEAAKKKLYLQELINLIRKYQDIKKNISRFASFFNRVFLIQLTNSGLIICCSVYALVFTDDNIILYVTYLAAVLYNLFDIFMIAYFGNEIEVASSRLAYCLFESNWTGQSIAFKTCFVILAEMLKRPQRIIVSKLYPLNLATFTSILNVSYRMFNILLKLKE